MSKNLTIKRILAFAMACALLFGGVQALADQVYINGSATVYVQPSESAEMLGTLKSGTKVAVAAEKGGWAMLKKGNAVAYVKSSDLIRVESTGSIAAYAASDAPMYRTFSTGSKQLGTIAAGASVTVTARAGDMAYVKYGKYKGFVAAANLTTQAPAKSAAAEQSAAPAYRTVYVAKDGAKVYSAKGRVIGTLPANTELSLAAVKGGVCQVKKGGRTAYMFQSDLSESRVTVEPAQEKTEAEPAAQTEQSICATAYANKDGAKVYSAKGQVIGSLPANTAVTVTAVKGDVCRVTANGATAYMKKADLSASKTEAPATQAAAAPTGASTVAPARGPGKEMDWWTSDIQSIFARGTTAQITDVATGIAWREQRRGGTNHADVQPLTAADTAAMKKACGSWSWSRRAIIVTINGVNYAASMNCMPHGGGSITDNNFNGHHCIHFTNSRTHGGNKVCPLHQAAIKKAAGLSK